MIGEVIVSWCIDTLYPTQDRKLFILCIKSIHYNTCYAYKLLSRKSGSVSRLDRIVEEQSKIESFETDFGNVLNQKYRLRRGRLALNYTAT